MLIWITSLLLSFTHAAGTKATCTARELRGQDCRIAQGTYAIRLLAETVARDDGTWHTVDPMPLKGAGVVWEKVQFDVHHGLPLLQFWLWDAGKGEAQVQALHWYVTDARKGSLKILNHGVVRRRRLKPIEEVAADPAAKPGAKAPAVPKPSFLYDEWEKHSAKVLKMGQVEWQLGADKKILDPNAADVKPVEKHGTEKPATETKAH